jgi:hypothetical protein
MDALVEHSTVGPRNTFGFTEDLPFAFNRIGLFRQVFPPVLDALFHIFRLNNSALKVRLQSYTAGKGSLVSVGQTVIPVNTTQALTNPGQANKNTQA